MSDNGYHIIPIKAQHQLVRGGGIMCGCVGAVGVGA